MLNVYFTKTLHYDKLPKTILNLCNIEYIEKDINELIKNNKYIIFPIFQINDNIIYNYNNLNELFNQLNIEKLSLDNIHDNLLNIIYNNINNNKIYQFIELFNYKEIEFYVKDGLMLAHHIVLSNNNKLLKYILIQKKHHLSKYLTNSNIKNQTILHISAQHNKKLYNYIKKFIPDIYYDDNMKLAIDYYKLNIKIENKSEIYNI
jgi:hypothetical protein